MHGKEWTVQDIHRRDEGTTGIDDDFQALYRLSARMFGVTPSWRRVRLISNAAPCSLLHWL
jgi:hypothetical protein